MTHYRAQPEDDAVLIVLCAVRDGQFGKSTLNEVIDLWVAGQIGRVEALEIIAGANENATTIPTDHDRLVAIHALLDPPGTSLKSIEELIEELIRGEGAVKERDRLREVLRAVLMEPDPIKRNQLAAPVLTNPGGGSIPGA